MGSVAEVIGEEDVETEPPLSATIRLWPTASIPMAMADPLSTQDEAEEDEASEAPAAIPTGAGRRRRPERRTRLPIEQQLKRNQEIIVQVAKEPLGTKGARLTSFVSLPGRHLVYTPTSNHIGISRRIESAQERARLRCGGQ